jgi:hypothetical protein
VALPYRVSTLGLTTARDALVDSCVAKRSCRGHYTNHARSLDKVSQQSGVSTMQKLIEIFLTGSPKHVAWLVRSRLTKLHALTHAVGRTSYIRNPARGGASGAMLGRQVCSAVEGS